jgi:ABC-type transport system involved in cytochrome bd biosynthesis fused ATPase/permease subunit
MSKFQTLSEMGINNPGEVERYSLNTTNNIDVLRIVYKRKKSSFLPTSKRFEFGRSEKTVVADSGTGKTEILHVISPFLQKAMKELDEIISTKKSNIEHAKLVKQELQRLHQDMASRLVYIESLIDEM